MFGNESLVRGARQAGRSRSRPASTVSGQSRLEKWIGPTRRRAGRRSSYWSIIEPHSTVAWPLSAMA